MLVHSDRKLLRGSETQLGLEIIGEALVSDADAFCHLHQHERRARSSDERGRETAVADRRQPRGAGWRTSADNRSTLPAPTGGAPAASRAVQRAATWKRRSGTVKPTTNLPTDAFAKPGESALGMVVAARL